MANPFRYALVLVALVAMTGFPACSSEPPAEKGWSGRGGGVRLVKDAAIYFGSATNCSTPATIDYARVRSATPEWRTIETEGVRPGSARYSLLSTSMHERIVAAARKAAGKRGCDLVVRQGDIADVSGLKVLDLTDDVIAG